MVKTKIVTSKSKGKAPASSFGQADEIVREMEEEEEMIANPARGHAKRRTAAEVRAATQKKWEEGIQNRGFKNERHVDVDNLGIENPFVRRIREQVPSEENEKKDDAKITSKIGKILIEVTSGFIARVLNYRQPPTNDVNYPDEEYVVDDAFIQELYKIPREVNLPHVLGKFKDDYRLVNQLVHHNFNPRGTENKSDIHEGGMIHEFMNTNVKVPASKFVDREKLNPGDINSSILTRSISQSRPATAAAPRGAYLTTLPPKGAKSASWNKLLFCQRVAIMGCIKEDQEGDPGQCKEAAEDRKQIGLGCDLGSRTAQRAVCTTA
ncbi:hypothetical protein RHMOL_Rhmol04G0212000 [Rhododendron molle]|uniref:Uncharacterized protein n=1 Tax=Rhododendron molle TaxID=49168 RepID=A0ACC0P4Z5_RHOML|nr:hypothetical protein RHMOL_Rhmol04G0212000 [Rhododendron molle]